MNYDSLFNLLYSTEISEATKVDIINKIQEPIEESYEVQPLTETYLELLDTLVYSTASETLIYNIIDETFSQLSEEAINEVSDEWIKRKTEAGLKAREKTYNQARDNIVGLASLNRAAKAGERLEKGREQVANRAKVTPLNTKSTAINKLKSAVGKVKSFVSNVDKGPEHVGLSRLVGAKANKDNTGAETLRQQTTHKEEKPQEVSKAPEVKSAEEKVGSKPKRTKTVKPKVEEPKSTEVKVEASKVDNKPEVKSEVKPRKNNMEDTYKKAMALGNKLHKQMQASIKKMDKEKAARDKAAKKEESERIKKNQAGLEALKAQAQKVKQPKPEVKMDEVQSQERPNSKVKNGQTVKSKTAKVENSSTNKGNTSGKKTVAKAIANTEVTDNSKANTESGKTPEQTKREKAYMARLKRELTSSIKDRTKTLETLKQRRQDMTSKPGYDPQAVKDLDKRISDLESSLGTKEVSEALSELIFLLANTNISESSFEEIFEMTVASKANAERVKNRHEDEVKASIDALYKDVEEGKPVDPEKVKDAEEKRKRKEHFEELFQKKFNNNK